MSKLFEHVDNFSRGSSATGTYNEFNLVPTLEESQKKPEEEPQKKPEEESQKNPEEESSLTWQLGFETDIGKIKVQTY